MKTLIVYYSLDGSCDIVAQKLKELTGAAVERIKLVKDFKGTGTRRYFAAGLQLIFNRKPKIQSISVDLKDFDTVVIGTPVWGGTMAPAMSTFLLSNNLSGKKVFAYVCLAGTDLNNVFIFDRIKENIGCEIVATEFFTEPVKGKEINLELKLKNFAQKIKN